MATVFFRNVAHFGGPGVHELVESCRQPWAAHSAICYFKGDEMDLHNQVLILQLPVCLLLVDFQIGVPPPLRVGRSMARGLNMNPLNPKINTKLSAA